MTVPSSRVMAVPSTWVQAVGTSTLMAPLSSVTSTNSAYSVPPAREPPVSSSTTELSDSTSDSSSPLNSPRRRTSSLKRSTCTASLSVGSRELRMSQ
jgi:hypothetical protein